MIFLPTDLNKKNLNSVPGYGIHFSTVLKSKKEVRGMEGENDDDKSVVEFPAPVEALAASSSNMASSEL